jgi:hypothetical protein
LTGCEIQPPGGPQPSPWIVHSNFICPRPFRRLLRHVAFKERRKIHDIVLEGIKNGTSHALGVDARLA